MSGDFVVGFTRAVTVVEGDAVQFVPDEGEAGTVVSSEGLPGDVIDSTDGDFLSFSFFFKPGGTTLTGILPIRIVNGSNWAGLIVRGSTATRLEVTVGAGSATALIVESTDIVVTDDWYSVIFSADTNHANGAKLAKLYIDRVDVTGTVTDGQIAFDIATDGFSANIGDNISPDPPTPSLAEVWIAPNQTLLTAGDITATTLDKFVTAGGAPVDLGANGSTPTGVQPVLYFKGGSGTFATNLGTGGSPFTVPFGTLLTVTGPP